MLIRPNVCRAIALALPLLSAAPLVSATLATGGGDAAARTPALGEHAELVPERAFLYVEAPGLSGVLESGLEHPFVANFLASEIGQVLLAKSEFAPDQILAWAQLMLGAPVLETLATLSAQGTSLAVLPPASSNGPPGVLVLSKSADADVLERTLERLLELADKDSGRVREARSSTGAELWDLDDGNVMARRGALFVFGSSEALVSEALSLEPDDSLAAREDFAALAESSEEHLLRGFLDLDALRTLDPEEFRWTHEGSGRPEAQAFFGPGLSALASGSSLRFALGVRADELLLELAGDELDIASVLHPRHARAAARVPAELTGAGEVGQALVYRDFASFVRERVDLFAPEHLPGIAEGLSGFSLFFGGKDFGEDVLTKVSPWMRLVSRDVEYRAGATPSIEWPGLALVARLDDAERLGPECMAAFQSVIGIVNVDSAQKGARTSMLLGLELEGDVQISSARYLPPAAEESVDAIYNLEPACAVVGDSLVLGTHVDVVRSVVRSLAAEAPSGRRDAAREVAPVESLELAGSALAEYVRLNMDTLVTQKVVDEGLSFEKAQEDIEGLRLALASLRSARLDLTYGAADALRATLRLRLASRSEDEAR